VSRGARCRLATAEVRVVPPDEGCCVLGKIFGFNRKIMINF